MATSSPFWHLSTSELVQRLHTSTEGLTNQQAEEQLIQQRKNQKVVKGWYADFGLLVGQFKSPLVLLLVVAVVLSLLLGEYSDSAIILAVLLITGCLGFI